MERRVSFLKESACASAAIDVFDVRPAAAKCWRGPADLGCCVFCRGSGVAAKCGRVQCSWRRYSAAVAEGAEELGRAVSGW